MSLTWGTVQYDQIYKIAYLKIKGIEGITDENLEELFRENCLFSIHGGFSTGGLYSYLTCSNISHDHERTIVCLFDFDNEGYEKFKKLETIKADTDKMFGSKNGDLREGIYLKHNQANRYALMLPIPERLGKYVDERTSNNCFIEIESLISEEYLRTNDKAEKRSEVLPFYIMKDKHKRDFWKDLLAADRECFNDFIPLFNQVENLINKE